MSVILNRREAATVIAGLRLLAGDGVPAFHILRTHSWRLYDETDPEYDLRFEADEEYVRELIDRIEGCRCAVAFPDKCAIHTLLLPRLRRQVSIVQEGSNAGSRGVSHTATSVRYHSELAQRIP